ncbi:MAG: DUF6290 family protein [Anaerococcus sp.]|jgi:RHH-type rel operon transcriptional repressor/antitoxin RelB|nr:DUF6290 family protein [Peptoniphilaceae bacterium]MDY3054937.1 DUF6290 family protein [Anaerococcus sp.]
MTTVTIRLSEEDKELFKKISEEKEKSLSDWARETLLQAIEEEYSEEVVRDYLLNKDKMNFYTSDQVKKELGL